MIGFLKGKIIEKRENYCLIEVNNVGYEVNISTNTLLKLTDDIATLYTYMQVKEDGVNLFGFSSKQEKELFLKLITVNGVGPKMALTILSGASLSDITMAIISEDSKMLSRFKGVGKKTAERIVLELKEKLNENVELEDILIKNDLVDTSSSIINDALMALITLGLSRTEALNCIKKVYVEGDTSESLLEKVLKSLSR